MNSVTAQKVHFFEFYLFLYFQKGTRIKGILLEDFLFLSLLHEAHRRERSAPVVLCTQSFKTIGVFALPSILEKRRRLKKKKSF